MRLQGEEYSKRLEGYSYDTLFLLSKAMCLPKAFNDSVHDITTDSELDEKEVARRLRKLLGFATLLTFDRFHRPNLTSTTSSVALPGNPYDCRFSDCVKCAFLLDCVEQAEWPYDFNGGTSIKIEWNDKNEQL